MYYQEFVIYIYRERLMPICPVQTHHVKWILCNISIYKFTRKALINKHQVKAVYFQLMCLWKCSLNWWRYCKIVLFYINALDLWLPWTIQWYTSTLGESWNTKSCCSNVQRNNDGSHTGHRQSFNCKSTFSSLLTITQAAFFIVGLFCSPCSFETGSSHFTTLYFNFYAHQSTAMDLITGVWNTLYCKHAFVKH